MIDIIIPAYNAHKTIIKTLYSIAIQDFDKKINVYICNDCSTSDYSKIIKKFNNILNIKEFKLSKNSGPGIARQLGIDNSNSKYIIFIDADDVFYTPLSIKLLYDKISQNNLDVVIGNFLEELDNAFIEHKNDYTWLHGKIYSRDFINKNNIRFNNSLGNEDNFFNKSIFIRNPSFDFLDQSVYLWKKNNNSITRKNNYEYNFYGIFDYIYNMTQVLINAINDGINFDYISEYSASFIFAVYFYYLEYYNNEESYKIIEKSYELKNIFEKYRRKNSNIEEDMYKSQFYFFSKNLNYINVIKPKITFEDFLKLYRNEEFYD